MIENLPITIDKIRVKPTHIAQTCPVCNGWTTVKHGALHCGACKDENGISRGYILIPAQAAEERRSYGE